MKDNMSGDLFLKIDNKEVEYKYLTFMNNYYIIIDSETKNSITGDKLEFIIDGESKVLDIEIMEKASRVEHTIMHMNMNNYCDYEKYTPGLFALRIKGGDNV